MTNREKFRENKEIQRHAMSVVAAIDQIIMEIENIQRCTEIVQFVASRHIHLKGKDTTGAFFTVSLHAASGMKLLTYISGVT